MPKFGLSIIGMKRAKATAECLERMMRLAPADTSFYATSNGCDDTAKELRKIARKDKRLTVTENTSNEGFQRPHHLQFVAAAQAGCQYVLIANDDIEVPEGYLEKLAEPMDRDPQVAITGPSGTCTHLDDNFHGTGGAGPPHYIEGSLSLIRVEVIQRLRNHLWCPGLRHVYSEDSSLGLFVQEKGYKIALVEMHAPHLRSATVNGDPETKRFCQEAQEHNHALNLKRWAYWVRHRNFAIPIVVKREYAIGDVVLITPVIDAIRRSRPLSPIHVQTKFPELFAADPRVASSGESIRLHGPSLMVDLDGSYEHTTQTHIVDAYWQTAASTVTGLEPHEWTTRLHPSAADMAWAEKRVGDRSKVVAIASDPTTWRGKNWPHERMAALAMKLKREGWYVIAMGSKDRMLPVWADLNLVGQATLMQTTAVLAKSSLCISPCTSIMHLAQAVGCPVVGLFGVTRSRFVTTRGSKVAAVESPEDMPNSGIRHRVTGQTFVDGGQECMEAISVEQVLAAVKKLEL